jgi:hypothetical protein
VFHNVNFETTVNLSTPNLPFRYEIENSGSGGAATISQISSTLMSEGGSDKTGELHYVSTASRSGNAHVDCDAADTLYAMIGMRLKAASLDQQVDFQDVTVIAETNDDFEWVVMYRPTVASTFTYADVDNASVQVAYGATANTVTGGTPMVGGLANSTSEVAVPVDNALRLGSLIDGTPTEIVLCCRPLGANANIHSTLVCH